MTNQRETVCVWDPATGEPLHAAIVWQDRRTAARCDELRAAGHEPLVRARTGLVLDPYFSATKIQWLLEHVEGLRERAADGRAVFGTVDSWLSVQADGRARDRRLQRLAHDALRHRRRRAGTPSCSSCSACPSARCRGVEPSAGDLGETRPEALHGHVVPVAGVAGDQQAALFGQACVDPGMGKNTYGTGSFVLLNAGFTVPEPPRGLLATVAWGIGGSCTYALEASIFVTGAAVQWLRDGLGDHRARGGVRGARRLAEGQRRRVLRPGAHRPRLAALGSPRARDDRGAHRGARPARTWRARRSRRSPTRRSTLSARWRRRAGSR